MTAPCYYHPDIHTETTCAQCGIPICSQCREIVADKPVCKNCVSAITARLQRELDNPVSNPSSMTPPQQRAAYQQQAVPQVLTGASEGPDSVSTPVHLLLGGLAGLMVGILGGFIWSKITFYSHFNIGYITALIGGAVGYVVVMVGKRAGIVAASISAVIGLISQLVGYLFLLDDYVQKQYPGEHLPLGDMLTTLPSTIDPFGWVMIALGVYFAYKAPMRTQARR